MKRYFTRILFIMLVMGLILSISLQPGRAQSPDGNWSDFVNISNTPTASTYPCVAADTEGNVHVFWSEDVGGMTENPIIGQDGSPQLDTFGDPINYLMDTGNSLFYSRWDGNQWSSPVDIQYNPGGKIVYPEAVADTKGMLHVIWVSANGPNAMLFYSDAPIERAGSAAMWSKPVMLAQQILFAYYPAGITADPSGGLHILYSQLGVGAGAYIINSYDNGLTWSEPISIYNTNDPIGGREGVSTVRIVTDQKGRLHATWTRYGSGGNGKAILYSQSRDSGRTWSDPFEVATWQPGWYEVDWLNVGVVEDEIHLVWEGSSRVATQVERISHDSGLTWSEPGYILPNIVGENGFADLVTDSADQLHLLVVKRGDPDGLSNGIWYTSWKKDRWQDPILLGATDSSLYKIVSQLDGKILQGLLRGTFTSGGLRYQVSAIVNGNELFTIVVNEYDGEIWESHTTLSVPFIPPHPFPQSTATPTTTPTSRPEILETPQSTSLPQPGGPPSPSSNPASLILFGTIPAMLLIVGFLTYNRIFKQNH